MMERDRTIRPGWMKKQIATMPHIDPSTGRKGSRPDRRSGVLPELSRRQLLIGIGAAACQPAGGARAAPDRVAVWFDRSHDEFVALVGAAMRDGSVLRSLSLYGTRAAPLYAGVMMPPEKPVRQRWFAALTADQLQTQTVTLAAENFAAVTIAAVGPPDNPLFAVVFQSPAPMTRLHLALRSGRDTDPGTIENLVYQSKKDGYLISSAAVYGTAADRRFATVSAPNDDKVAWDVDGLADDDQQFRERLAAQTAGWCRLQSLAVGPDGRRLSIFHHDTIGPWTVRDRLDAGALVNAIESHRGQELRPVLVQAGGDRAGAATFTALFARNDAPAPPAFTATGPRAEPGIDSAMKDIMTAGAIRQAGLAIVKGSRLVFARGYTFAQPDWPLAQPTTVFRLGSVSKTIAALAIYQLVEAGKLRLGDRMQDILQLRTPSGGLPKDRRFGAVTVEHLLAHTSGLSPHVLSSTSIYDAHRVSQPGRTWHLPVTAAMATSFLASIDLISDPGAKNEYNNCGYFMLGQILARVHAAATPAAALERHLFAPLGITRIRRARSLLADQPADEARYRVGMGRDHVRVLPLARSVMSDSRPLVPLGYGQECMEIHECDGGLSAAMTDLARLLAILSSRRDTPAIRGQTVTMMLANAAARRGHGFDGAKDKGDGTFVAFKGGSLPSTWGALQFDGDLGFVVAWSGGIPPDKANWFPNLPTVMAAARRAPWGDDLFPQFGMASLS